MSDQLQETLEKNETLTAEAEPGSDGGATSPPEAASPPEETAVASSDTSEPPAPEPEAAAVAEEGESSAAAAETPPEVSASAAKAATEAAPTAAGEAEESAEAAAAGEEDDEELDPANQTPEMIALMQAMEEKQPIEGQVIGWNKGGYHVALGKIAAFCPVSQIEIGNPRSPKRYLDKAFKFMVIEIQKGGRRIVLSRADALKHERKARAAAVREKLKVGEVHKGRVSSLTDFGAFVDLGGGIEGLVHVSELSRKRVDHPKEILQAGQEVEVAVIKIEKGGQRISLSMKRLEDDPWEGIKERFKPGDTFSGKVLRQAEFGFFVEVEAGLEGLVHNSRLPLGAAAEDESLAAGATVEGWIHDVDAKRRRLSLSLRPVATTNPWNKIEERYREDSIVTGTVERLAPFGAFIELEPGLTGLLPFSALPGIGNPRKQFHPGKEVQVRVLSIDRERRRISLGTEASQAEGSNVDYREYKKQQQEKTPRGLNAMAAAFEKLKEQLDDTPVAG